MSKSSICFTSVLGLLFFSALSLQAAPAPAPTKAATVKPKAVATKTTAAPKATVVPTAVLKAQPTAVPKVEPSPAASPSPQATAVASPSPEVTPVATALAVPAAEAPGHRSPALAGVLAFIPGIAIPGTGHFYAGSWRKGIGLLALQAASVTIGVSQYKSGYNDINDMYNKMKDNNGQIPNNVGSAYRTLGVLLVCTTTSLYCWFDDISGAPVAAMEYNKKLDAEAKAKSDSAFFVLPQENGGALLAWSTKF